jgi:hypothetical protein
MCIKKEWKFQKTFELALLRYFHENENRVMKRFPNSPTEMLLDLIGINIQIVKTS